MTPHDPTDAVDARLEDLEIRFAFIARQVDALDGVVRELADTVGRLNEQVRALQEQVSGTQGPSGGMLDEVPPHY